ncbi:dihydrolipoamide acetyltransferase family protein [Streptomyces diacarni]|uniref:dihydrolipoamide acetyltransferase family protein n=1 Tax=Streptomyces diacarni TaxID=2800381 RepID=UPI003403FEEA
MGEVREFRLPDLGEGLTEATVVRWLVAVGETVRVDQPVVEVETAKALVEVPCPYAGMVTSHAAEEGGEVEVGAPLVTVAVSPSDSAPRGDARGDAAGSARGRGDRREEGERTGTGNGRGGGEGTGDGPKPEHVGGSGNVLVGYGTAPAPGRRPRVTSHAPEPAAVRAPDAGVNGAGQPLGANGTGQHHGMKGTARTPVPVISPLVRRLAREHAVDLREMRGSGPDGLILRADVERAVRASETHVARTARGRDEQEGYGGQRDGYERGGHERHTAERAGGAERAERRIPLRGMRGTAADRLSRSRSEIPDASCWVDADATELLAARRQMNAASSALGEPAAPVSLLALLGRICTAALTRFPELNARVDTEAREIVVLPEVHLGFAAQTDRGLVVPVVRDAHTLSAERLTDRMSRLTETARAGTLSPTELTGGTFTLNNYGVFGVDGSTPIINYPEAAMLGVGRIARKPWVVGEELAVRSVVQLSLTFDHRVCDGGTAGGFLRLVADCVEQPARLLRTL